MKYLPKSERHALLVRSDVMVRYSRVDHVTLFALCMCARHGSKESRRQLTKAALAWKATMQSGREYSVHNVRSSCRCRLLSSDGLRQAASRRKSSQGKCQGSLGHAESENWPVIGQFPQTSARFKAPS